MPQGIDAGSGRFVRRITTGAEVHPRGGAEFRVWAPMRKHVAVVVDEKEWELKPEGDGYYSGLVEQARPGSLYRYRLDRGEAYPDPSSRFQPEGPHGPSQVVDPAAFHWTDAKWAGCSLADQAHSIGIAVILDVVYNHCGPDGNYLSKYSSDYVTDKYSTDWGTAINFDGPNSGPVREFYAGNAAYWIDKFHMDGLLLDLCIRLCTR